MKLHWKVLIGMLLGLLAGLALQAAYPAPAWLGATFVPAEGGVAVDRIRSGSPVAKAKLQRGDVLTTVILDGIPDTPMPPWRPLMTEEEAEWIARYLLTPEEQ